MPKPSSPIAMLGGGSWGTALAIALARNGSPVRLWDRDAAHIEKLQQDQANHHYLPNIPFPKGIFPIASLKETLQDIQDIFIAVPSYAFHAVLKQIFPLCQNTAVRIAWGTKGVDPESLHLLHQCVEDIFGSIPMAALSGPSFAKELAIGLPTAVVAAGTDASFVENLIERFHSAVFRVYRSEDLIGVEIGGAVKNVIAIAVGVSDGLGFGANARSALITRGLAEMARLGGALGAQRETFMGLAGLGDLVLTATDDQSRNRRFGKLLGMKKSVEEAKTEIMQSVEGISNAFTVYQLAKQHHVEMPIVECVYKIIHGELSVENSVEALLGRAPRASE